MIIYQLNQPNFLLNSLDLLQAVRGYTEVYKRERIFRIWLGWEPLLILWKPETVETVLSHNFLLDKSSEYNMLHSWLGTGLLTSTGAKWRIRRKMLVPAFHFKVCLIKKNFLIIKIN